MIAIIESILIIILSMAAPIALLLLIWRADV